MPLKSRVAIIGRPNVGKSTLFNILVGQRRSLVKDQSGVTRDLIFAEATAFDKTFDLVDTGGLTDSEDLFSRLIKERVSGFIHEVDFCIIVMDAKTGVVPEDRELIKLAMERAKPCLLVINKVDSDAGIDETVAEFFEFGLPLIAASFEQRRGLGDILEWLSLNVSVAESSKPEGFQVAIVGKPNVGKSSLFNRILGEDRVMVSPVAGTTIDAIDEAIEIDGEPFIFVDTAGMRRQSKRDDELEELSVVVAKKSIERADLVLLVIDGTEGPSDQDARVMQMIEETHKGVIIVVNKSDIGKKEIPEFRKLTRERIEKVFHFFQNPYIVFTSAHTGSGVDDLLKTICLYKEKFTIKIGTGELNRFFQETIRKAPAPIAGTRTVKFYYLTQTQQVPPSFIAFANHPEGVNRSYRRFLANQIRERWELQGIPIRMFVMKNGGRPS